MNGWQAQLLTLLGIPVNQNNVNWMTNWFNSEEPNGGFGPGYYSYYQNNPINIKVGGSFANFGSPNAGLTNTAQWLMSNGNFGNLGTYAQEIKAYLTGQPNNLASSLAYFSGHGGDPSGLTTSYQRLVSGSGSSSAAGTYSPTVLTTQTQQDCAWWDLACHANNIATGALTATQNAMNAIEANVLVMGAAIALLLIGGLWVSKTNVMQLIPAQDGNGNGDSETVAPEQLTQQDARDIEMRHAKRLTKSLKSSAVDAAA